MNSEALIREIPVGFHALHPDVTLNFQMNRFLPGAQLEEVRSCASRIHDLADWKREYLSLGRAAEDAGRVDAARAYYRAAHFFIPHHDPDKQLTYERFRALTDPLIEQTGATRRTLAFGPGLLPCIEYPQSSPRDTLLLHSGFDGFQEDMLVSARVLQAAGYRVISFDGPGQGAALSQHGLHLTPDWHEPVAAVLDAYGIARCTILGMSLGGCLALRAAARERRIARAIVWGVMSDFLACFVRAGGPYLGRLLRLGLNVRADPLIERGVARRMHIDPLAAWGIPHGMYTLGVHQPAAFLREAARFTTRDISKHVQQDVLLFGGAEDHYVPPDQFFDQARALSSARSVTTRRLTRAEHAQNHCAQGNHRVVLRTILHWLDERLAAAGEFETVTP